MVFILFVYFYTGSLGVAQVDVKLEVWLPLLSAGMMDVYIQPCLTGVINLISQF